MRYLVSNTDDRAPWHSTLLREVETTLSDVTEILSRAGIFQGVDPVAVRNLIHDLETVRFPRGTTIFDEGEPGDRLYIITEGKVKLARHAADGRETS